MDRMQAGGEPDQEKDAMAASVAAIAASMERSRVDHIRTRRRAAWSTWIIRGLLIALFIFAAVGSAMKSAPLLGDQIARFTVQGVITDDPDRDALMKKIAADDNVKALIVRVNSPGGTTTGGEALYESLRAVAAKKPVVAVMGEVAASAGYIAAMAGDHVVARGNTITASVGVIFTAPNFHQLMENVGVSVVELKSGARKAEPSPYKPVDPQALAFERELVDDSFEWFLGLVRERRAPGEAVLNRIRDGRVLTGRMAAEAGLVDAIGGEGEALAWLQGEKGLADTLPVVEREVKKPEAGVVGLLRGALGLEELKGLGAGGEMTSRLQRLFGGPSLLSVLD